MTLARESQTCKNMSQNGFCEALVRTFALSQPTKKHKTSVVHGSSLCRACESE
jgi:hypothetical protein